MSGHQHRRRVQQQLEALDRLATQTAADLAAIKAALVVGGILEFTEPATTGARVQAPSSPRRLYLVKEGAQ